MKKVIILFLYLLWGLSVATAQSQDPWVGTWTSESYKALDSESEGQVYTDFRYVVRISKSEDKYFVRAKTVKVTDPKSAIYNDAYGIKNYYCPLNIHIPTPTLCNTGIGMFYYLRQAPSSVY